MKAACGQMRAVTMDEAASVWPMVERHAEAARSAGADLLLLPETTYPAYWLESVERYMRPDIDRSPLVLTRFGQIARRHGLWLVAGFVEEREGRLHNSAAVFDRRGDLVHVARKSFLWDCDNRWFAPGWHIAAFDSEFGRIGVLICADCRAPEIAATLVADGARMLLLPTAWVNVGLPGGAHRNIHPEFLIRARAMEFAVPFVCCSKCGLEGDKIGYVGRSRIVDAAGALLADAGASDDELIVADVQPGPGRPSRISDSQRARLFAPPAASAGVASGLVEIDVTSPLSDLRGQLESAGAGVAAFGAGDAATFVSGRCAALDGASVLVFNGPLVDESLLRARAAENRVFVVAGSNRAERAIAPDGEVVWSSDAPAVAERSASAGRSAASSRSVSLDLAQAQVKRFTPDTDLWIQRRVACYRLGQAAERRVEAVAQRP